MGIVRQWRPFAALCSCLFVLSIAGCSQSPKEQGSKPADPPAQPQPEPEDLSLDPAAYIRLGAPAHDRQWSADDMKRAFEALNALASKEPRQLPRYKSSRSGVYFSRLTDEQNLRFYRDRSLPIGVRLPQAANFLQSGAQILKLYLATFLKKATGGGELVELTGAQLRTTVVLLELSEEFLPTLNKDDPTYPARMQGLARMKEGLAIMVSGALLVLTERPYRIEDRQRLLGYLEATLPAIVPQLPPNSRLETLGRLDRLAEDPSIPELHSGLRRLLARLRADTKEE